MSAQASAGVQYHHHESQPKPGLFNAVKEVYTEFSEDDVMTQSAALAFYSGLAFAPLLTICVWAASIFMGDAAKDQTAKAFEQVHDLPLSAAHLTARVEMEYSHGSVPQTWRTHSCVPRRHSSRSPTCRSA